MKTRIYTRRNRTNGNPCVRRFNVSDEKIIENFVNIGKYMSTDLSEYRVPYTFTDILIAVRRARIAAWK